MQSRSTTGRSGTAALDRHLRHRASAGLTCDPELSSPRRGFDRARPPKFDVRVAEVDSVVRELPVSNASRYEISLSPNHDDREAHRDARDRLNEDIAFCVVLPLAASIVPAPGARSPRTLLAAAKRYVSAWSAEERDESPSGPRHFTLTHAVAVVRTPEWLAALRYEIGARSPGSRRARLRPASTPPRERRRCLRSVRRRGRLRARARCAIVGRCRGLRRRRVASARRRNCAKNAAGASANASLAPPMLTSSSSRRRHVRPARRVGAP